MSRRKKNKENIISTSDTIEVDRDKIAFGSVNSSRKKFVGNKRIPFLSITMIFFYIICYILFIKGVISHKEGILGLIINVFIHRSISDLINTIFVLIFCGFFIENYIKRGLILFVYFLSIVSFIVISMIIYPSTYYLGSFTIVSFFIGMSIYFSYRFRKFISTIDIYIYIALTFIGFFVSYMVNFYNIFSFILSYLFGILSLFIFDTKALRINKI